jgi:putative restriction endonuclease
MAAFWVTQNKTFEQELRGGYLWAPLRYRGGNQRRHHTILGDMSPGDLILSYVGRRIVAIGFVASDPEHRPKPDDLDAAERWQRDGWWVAVRFTLIPTPLEVPPLTSRLLQVLPAQHSPLNRDGTGAQGYAFHLPPRAEALLLRELGLGVVDQVVGGHLDAVLPDQTVREAIVQARVGQGQFRDDVLAIWRHRCAVTGMAIRELVRASHIKPWRAANNRERLDPYNGLALSPNYDAAFDRGIVSFRDDGRVLIAPYAPRRDIEKLAFRSDHQVVGLRPEHAAFLRHHREAFGFDRPTA